MKLRIVGCHPPEEVCHCPFVEVVGFLDKSVPVEGERYRSLMLDTHFLTTFPRADASPLAFCEANAFGGPVLATSVGGIPTIISSGINGQLFPHPIELNGICNFIISHFDEISKYKTLSINSRHSYENDFNWDVAGRALSKIIENVYIKEHKRGNAS